MWDYAPDNGESCSGSVEPFGDNALVAVTANSTRIGRTYIKALFVEYTDATFQTKKVTSVLPLTGIASLQRHGRQHSRRRGSTFMTMVLSTLLNMTTRMERSWLLVIPE